MKPIQNLNPVLQGSKEYIACKGVIPCVCRHKLQVGIEEKDSMCSELIGIENELSVSRVLSDKYDRDDVRPRTAEACPMVGT